MVFRYREGNYGNANELLPAFSAAAQFGQRVADPMREATP